MESGEIASDFDKDTIKCLKNFFHLDLLCFWGQKCIDGGTY
jgi:hypothetical protein